MRANMSTAIAVTRQLGIADEVALRGMRRARPDPGAATAWAVHTGAREVYMVDATAANDPDSLEAILGPPTTPRVFVFHHRADRPFRLRQFADAFPWHCPDDVVLLTGDRPDWLTWRRVRQGLGPNCASIVSTGRLGDAVGRTLAARPETSTIVCCGNSREFKIDQLRTAVERA